MVAEPIRPALINNNNGYPTLQLLREQVKYVSAPKFDTTSMFVSIIS